MSDHDEVAEVMEVEPTDMEVHEGGRFDIAQVEDPTRALEKAEEVVSYMASKCNGPKYIAEIQGRQYAKCEWWTTVGASLGLFPREESCRKLDREETAYEATVGVYNGDQCVTRASAICSCDESTWSGRDEYAIRSMAITRATGKAYRIGLSFLAVMAGLEATPAEEMPRHGADREFSPENKVGFGKHSDLTWQELVKEQKGYAEWALKNADRLSDEARDWLEGALIESDMEENGPDLPDEDKARQQARQRYIAECAKHFEEPEDAKAFATYLIEYTAAENPDVPLDGKLWNAQQFDRAREWLADEGEDGVSQVLSWQMEREEEEV